MHQCCVKCSKVADAINAQYTGIQTNPKIADSRIAKIAWHKATSIPLYEKGILAAACRLCALRVIAAFSSTFDDGMVTAPGMIPIVFPAKGAVHA